MGAEFEQIRDKDRVVLECIREGSDDIQLITEATTLDNAAVNYCFRKLSKQDLITVEKPDGMVERVIDGTRQVFEAPKKAELTPKGYRCLKQADQDDGSGQYRSMTRDELVERVHELEANYDDLEEKVERIRQHVSEYILNNG